LADQRSGELVEVNRFAGDSHDAQRSSTVRHGHDGIGLAVQVELPESGDELGVGPTGEVRQRGILGRGIDPVGLRCRWVGLAKSTGPRILSVAY
jgi:hypothetical protein